MARFLGLYISPRSIREGRLSDKNDVNKSN